MRLVLSIGNKVLGVAPLDPKRSFGIDYIQAKVRLLKMMHLTSIAAGEANAVFYIQVASKMNRVKR
ncbi:MAG: hypothetical protein EOO10_08615 [Chitinophagaceae bacterium]|nr:MAG: hypothetical protein EOO10_08615 [Chitinophagaceae bacterium]